MVVPAAPSSIAMSSPYPRADGPSRPDRPNIAEARELGATLVGASSRWTSMLSPGRLPFCIVAGPSHQARLR